MRSVLSGVAALIAYGGWAVYANWAHGETMAWRAGLVQGGYSLILTFVMTLATEALFKRLAHLPWRKTLATGMISGVLSGTAVGIHLVAGTPEILMTILPGFTIGTAYTAVYLFGLERGTRSLE